VSGTRGAYFVRDTSRPSCAVGVHFRAGAAGALLGAPAGELAGRHTALVELWGAEAERARARIAELFHRAVGLTPKVYGRVRRFQRALDSAALARERGWCGVALASGFCDQPHLNREFRAFAGLAPGAYAPLPGRPNHVPVRDATTRSIPSKPRAPRRG
jgi:AraC-like DNA-binding protein